MKPTILKNLFIRFHHQNPLLLTTLLFFTIFLALPYQALTDANVTDNQKQNPFNKGVASYYQGDY